MHSNSTSTLARASWFWLALLALSCTKFASELDQLDTAGGALEGAPSLEPSGGDWSCLPGGNGPALSGAAGTGANAPAVVEMAAARAPLTYSFSVVDFVSAAPVERVRVRACFRPDVRCESPASAEVGPGSDGRVQVTTFGGFNGYLELVGEGMLPQLLFFSAPWSPVFLAQPQRQTVQLLPARALLALGDSARLPLDPESGVIAVTAYDCAGSAAAGVRLEIDTGSVPYAFVDDLPVANQDSTSEQGLAGFVNVPPGVVVVSGFPHGRAETVSVESLLVRTGWLSSASLQPGSAP
jgi:hypothetical protein